MSLIFTGVRLTNFLCFRGEHQVDLGPGVHALTADRDGDPRKSNAQGKSAFLWALRFVLTGDHPERTEDEWLTRGEPEGGVDAELSDGTFASRWRKRGQATKLKVVIGDRELWDDEAQKELDRRVGLSKAEQATTWWSAQGEPDAFVNGEPGETTAAVVSWCGVEPVRKAAKHVADALAQLLKQDVRHLAVLEEARREEKELAGQLPADLDAWRKPRLENLERLRTLAKADATERERAGERERILDEARKHAVLDQERRELEARPSIARAELELKQEARDKALAEKTTKLNVVGTRQRLAKGEFDGVCPVGGIECPVKDRLNADRQQARTALAEAQKDLSKAAEWATFHGDKWNEATEISRKHRDAEQRLPSIRARLEELAPSAATAKRLYPEVDGVEVEEAKPANAANDAVRMQEEELEKMAMLNARLTATRHRIATAEHERNKIEPDIVARREALQILGPSGAQRRLVEGFLGEVADAVNEDHARAGVDLRVTFEWQRELKDLASTCATCGQPFPSSTKVRQCEGCGAERGRKIEQKLRCRVDPKSGGMDALAGVGARLAGLAWLKARRGSSWSVVALDEPFAMVDAHHRMLAARHLVAMLGGHYAVEQAFVSAHDSALLAALPCRVVVHGGERGSSIEVVR